MTDFKFNPENHTYTLGGKPIIGLTSALKAAGFNNFEYVNEAVLELARERGKAVHKATELHDKRRLEENSVHENVAPYLKGWRDFLSLKRVQILDIEKPIYSKKYLFACTPDRIVYINGKMGVLEIKASDYLSDAYKMQTEGQRIAAEEFYKIKVTDRYVIRIMKDGTYRLETYNDYADKMRFLTVLSKAKGRA